MSLAFVREKLLAFLESPAPSVFCLLGRWGTGKTHAWNEALKEARTHKGPALKTYAYVSMFGINDVEDVVPTVFARIEDLSLPLDKKMSGPLDRANKAGSVLRKVTHTFRAATPSVTNAILSQFVSEFLICLDDIERKSGKVTLRDVFGVAVHLRDVGHCKVVLILNENSLLPEDVETLQQHGEKVFDHRVCVAPTPIEAATIALSEIGPFGQTLQDACTELGITNIRVMKKICERSRELFKILDGIDPDVLVSVLRSFVMIAWCVMSSEGEGAPPRAFLTERLNRGSVMAVAPRETDPAIEADRPLTELFTDYGFTRFDEVDRLMVEAIDNGFFDEKALRKSVETYLLDAERNRARVALATARTLFAFSLDDNEDEVRSAYQKLCQEHLGSVDVEDLDHIVRVLKACGEQSDTVASLAARFFELNPDRRAQDDESIREPEVREAHEAAVLKSTAASRTIKSAVESLANARLDEGDVIFLNQLAVSDFVKLLHDTRGDDLKRLIRAGLFFRRVSNANESQRELSEKVHAALQRIASESDLNALRLIGQVVPATNPD